MTFWLRKKRMAFSMEARRSLEGLRATTRVFFFMRRKYLEGEGCLTRVGEGYSDLVPLALRYAAQRRF
jgi:hypothetical protein